MNRNERSHPTLRATVRRGFKFLCQATENRDFFDEYTGDILWCFYCISATAGDGLLRNRALNTGVRLAKRWYASNRELPCCDTANEVLAYMAIVDTAARMGVRRPRIESHIRKQ